MERKLRLKRTVGVPHIACKLHSRRRERIIFRKLQFRGEHAAFERCFLRALDQRLPKKHIVFVDGTRGNAIGWVGGEALVFLE